MLIPINDIDTYGYYREKGYYPLSQWTKFLVNHDLRLEIQNYLFGKSELGKGEVLIANQKYYEYAYCCSLKVCQECCAPIHNYSSVHVSHILSRGAHSDLAHDLRNYNLLCGKHHNVWENGYRKGMKIYKTNQIIIEELKSEYSGGKSILMEIYNKALIAA